jgi:hypothetical protein
MKRTAHAFIQFFEPTPFKLLLTAFLLLVFYLLGDAIPSLEFWIIVSSLTYFLSCLLAHTITFVLYFFKGFFQLVFSEFEQGKKQTDKGFQSNMSFASLAEVLKPTRLKLFLTSLGFIVAYLFLHPVQSLSFWFMTFIFVYLLICGAIAYGPPQLWGFWIVLWLVRLTGNMVQVIDNRLRKRS